MLVIVLFPDGKGMPVQIREGKLFAGCSLLICLRATHTRTWQIYAYVSCHSPEEESPGFLVFTRMLRGHLILVREATFGWAVVGLAGKWKWNDTIHVESSITCFGDSLISFPPGKGARREVLVAIMLIMPQDVGQPLALAIRPSISPRFPPFTRQLI